MTKSRVFIASLCCLAVVALAGPIKSWTAGEVIVSSDLNANFQHIHNLMVGGHGARLVNADVNANAAISHSKLAQPSLLPKAFGIVSPACDGGTCAWTLQSGFSSSVTRASAGVYTVTFLNTRADAIYAPLVSVAERNGLINQSNAQCYTGLQSTTAFNVTCSYGVLDGGAFRYLEDIPFSVTVFDNN